MAKKRVGIRNGALFNQTSTLWNNLLAYYTGDGTPDDSLGNYNGTLVNGTTYGTGKINQGFSFDGVNDYISIDTNLHSFSSTEPHTYSAWINCDFFSNPGLDWITNNGDHNKGTGMVIRSKRLGFYYQGGNAVSQATTVLNENTWYHVVVTYDGNLGIKFYLNGVSDGVSSTLTPTVGAPKNSWLSASPNIPRLGQWYNGSHQFQGIMDEVGIWDRELSESEVTELYNNGNGKQYTPPVVSTPSIITDGLVLNLDAGNTLSYPGTGTDWFDLTSNNNDGVLTNGASYITDGGGSISFDGVNDFIQVGQISNVTTTTYISAWIKLGSLTDDYRIFGFGNGSSNTFQLIFEGDATNKPLGLNTYNNDLYGIDTTQVDYTNGWFNVTIGLHSNDFSSTKIYINGNNIQTSQKLGTSINRVFNNTFTIGTLQWNLASGWYFNGQISDVKIYNKTLTDSEVLQNYNATKGRFGL